MIVLVTAVPGLVTDDNDEGDDDDDDDGDDPEHHAELDLSENNKLSRPRHWSQFLSGVHITLTHTGERIIE